MSIEYDEKLSVPTPAGLDMQMEIAGIGGRSLAFLIDWHLRLLLACTWYLTAKALYSPRAWYDIDIAAGMDNHAFLFLGLVPAAAIYLLWHPVLEVALKGETPGKRWTGIRIVAADGGPPSAGALVLRNTGRVVDCLPGLYVVGLAFCTFTREQIRVGDLAAATRLVYSRETTPGAGDRTVETEDERVDALARELLERWDELELVSRHRIARDLITEQARRSGREKATPLTDRDLRDCLKHLAGETD